jgi:hypothetical protein
MSKGEVKEENFLSALTWNLAVAGQLRSSHDLLFPGNYHSPEPYALG